MYVGFNFFLLKLYFKYKAILFCYESGFNLGRCHDLPRLLLDTWVDVLNLGVRILLTKGKVRLKTHTLIFTHTRTQTHTRRPIGSRIDICGRRFVARGPLGRRRNADWRPWPLHVSQATVNGMSLCLCA